MSFVTRYNTVKRIRARREAEYESRPKGFMASLRPKKPYGWLKKK